VSGLYPHILATKAIGDKMQKKMDHNNKWDITQPIGYTATSHPTYMIRTRAGKTMPIALMNADDTMIAVGCVTLPVRKKIPVAIMPKKTNCRTEKHRN
jgi:hypothetical protein